MDLYAKDKVDEIIVLDDNMYNFLKEKKYKVTKFINAINVKGKDEFINNKQNDSQIVKIGLYNAEDRWNKNVYNQLCAVSLIENHELDCYPINYKISLMARKHNINIGGASSVVSKNDLYKKMAANDINLFICYPEFPNITPIESLELGTVCLVGKDNPYFKGTDLEEYVVVNNENDITQILAKIQNALANKDKILELYRKWKEEYDLKSKESITKVIQK